MNDLVSVAQRLRAVKRAHEDFFFRELIDEEIIGPMLLDRLAADLLRPGPGATRPDKTSIQPNLPNVDDQ